MQVCVLCRHFRLSFRTPDYSELTPGDPTEIECEAGQPFTTENDGRTYYSHNYNLDESEFFRAIRYAQHCPLYEQRESEDSE